MSVVEDVRQMLQDFIAPELRAINARLDSIDRRFQSVDQRFEDILTIMDTRFASLSKDVAQVKDMLDIDRRLTRLESKQAAVSQ